METQIKKKKKKVFLDNYKTFEVEENLNKAKLKEKLISVFRFHVGQENYINPYDLFVKVYGIAPEQMNKYKVKFLYDNIKKMISVLRHENTLIIINQGMKLYVLKTMQECDKFNLRLQKAKNGLTELQIKSKEWVNQERWRNF